MTQARWRWAALVGVVLAAIVIFIVRADRRTPARTTTGPAVSLAQARAGDFDVRVTAQGRIGAPAGSTSQLAFAVAGAIRSIDVRVGDRVVAGQALAHLDDTTFLYALQQAQGEARSASASYGGGAVPSTALASAQARVKAAGDYLHALEAGGPAAASVRAQAVAGTSQADVKVEADRRELAREQALYAGGIAARKDVDAAQAQLAADEADARALHAKAGGASASAVLTQARADYEQALADERAAEAQVGNLAGQAQRAQAALGQAEADEARTVLRAPADGVVVRIFKHPGEQVDATSPAIEIGPSATGSATLFVAAADAGQIRVGDPVMLRLLRAQSSTSTKVTAVVPSVDPATQESTVVVDGTPPGAVPGDAVNAVITVARRHGVLVPAAAIVQDPQTGKTLVFVKRAGGDGFDAREVVVAGSDETTAEIASGLRAGESVAAHGAYELMAPAGG